MVEKQRYSLDSTDMRGRVRGYNQRPVSDIRPRRVQNDPKQAAAYVPGATKPLAQPHIRAHNAQTPAEFVLSAQQPGLITKHPKKSKNLKAYSLVAAAFVMLGVGGFLTYQGYTNNQNVAIQAKALAQGGETTEDGRPQDNGSYDETPPPSNLSTYLVTADLPRLITIPDVGVYARIKRMATDNNNTVMAPKNVFDVGWYEGSSKPGQPGAMFFDGHVSGPTKGGIFANLKKISVGDIITVERGDLKKFKYRVVAKELFEADKVDMVKALKPYGTAKEGLNIMTCNGKFDTNTQTFDKRLLVYAVAE